ncbi:MAG: hypothetical protein GKC04_03515 [Methanomicrobiales archaeon]|nr:hypothetical protein [Methanomicrobiales archaeon]
MATAGLITFSAYAFDRGIENEEDSRRSAGLKKALIALAILACTASFILFPSFGLLLPFLITYLYSKGIAGYRLKGGAGRKNAVVGLTWAVLLAVLIGRFDLPALLVYSFFFAKSFVNTAIYDVRDREADLRAGIRTLPGVLPLPWFRALLLAVTGAFHAAVIAAASAGILCAGDIGVVSAAYTGAYVLVYSTGFSAWRNGIVDGEWMVYAIYSILRAFFL